MVAAVLALVLALAAVQLFPCQPEDLGEFRGVEELRQIARSAGDGVIQDDITVELSGGAVVLLVIPHGYVLGVAAEIVPQPEVESGLEHGHRGVGVDFLYGEEDLDGLRMEFPGKEDLLEVVVGLVVVELVLVLAEGVVERLLLIVFTLEEDQSGIRDGLPAVAAGDEAVDRGLDALDVDRAPVIGLGLAQVGLEDGGVLDVLDTEGDILHAVRHGGAARIELEVERPAIAHGIPLVGTVVQDDVLQLLVHLDVPQVHEGVHVVVGTEGWIPAFGACVRVLGRLVLNAVAPTAEAFPDEPVLAVPVGGVDSVDGELHPVEVEVVARGEVLQPGAGTTYHLIFLDVGLLPFLFPLRDGPEDAGGELHPRLREGVVRKQPLVRHELEHQAAFHRIPLAPKHLLLLDEFLVLVIILGEVSGVDVVPYGADPGRKAEILLPHALEDDLHLLLETLVLELAIHRDKHISVSFLGVVTAEGGLQHLEVRLDEGHDPVDEEIRRGEEVGIRPKEPDDGGDGIRQRIRRSPGVDTVSEEMPPQDILGVQVTARSAHLAGHHRHRVLEEEEVVRVALHEIQDEGPSGFSSGSADPLQIVRSQGRDADVQFAVQVTDVDTHLQGGGRHEGVDRVGMRPVLEVILHLLALLPAEQAGVLMGVDPRGLLPTVDSLVVILLVPFFQGIGSLAVLDDAGCSRGECVGIRRDEGALAVVAPVDAHLRGDVDLVRTDAIVRAVGPVHAVEHPGFCQGLREPLVEVVREIDIGKRRVEASCEIGEVPARLDGEGIVTNTPVGLVDDERLGEILPLAETAVEEVALVVPPV